MCALTDEALLRLSWSTFAVHVDSQRDEAQGAADTSGIPPPVASECYWRRWAIAGATRFLSRSQKVFFEKSQCVVDFEGRRKLNCSFAVIVSATECIYA